MGIGIIILSIGGIVAFFFHQTLSFILILLAFILSVVNIIVRVFQEKRKLYDLIAIGVASLTIVLYIVFFIVFNIIHYYLEEINTQIEEMGDRIVEKTEKGAADYEAAQKEEEEMLKQVQEFLNSSQ